MQDKKDLSFLNVYDKNIPWLKDSIIYLSIHGSHAYGTNIETSDLDYKGIIIPPEEYFFGYNTHFEQVDKFDADCSIYDIRKFFKLAADCNPNIIELLFTDPSEHLICHPIMNELFKHRELFLSKKARWTFSGYAFAQLKRIKGHRRYLLNPPTHKPTRAEFDLPEHTVIPTEQFEAAESLIKKKMDQWNFDFSTLENADIIGLQSKIIETMTEICGASLYIDKEELWKSAALSAGLDKNYILAVQKEKEYKAKLVEWNQYQEWIKNRNKSRAELEAKYGFDLKHGGHLYRLLKMSEEILTTGQVIVKRPDAQTILDIRQGKWTYEQLIEWAEKQEQKMDSLYKESKLPREPKHNELNKLCVELVKRFNKIQQIKGDKYVIHN